MSHQVFHFYQQNLGFTWSYVIQLLIKLLVNMDYGLKGYGKKIKNEQF